MDWEAFYNRFREADFVPGYEIQNRLGGGAFGEVYKARKHSIGKAYAIKFLKIDDDAQRDAVERELEQVRHFAAIDHPNLVTIEDLGTVMGVPYLVMGYAGEDTLARMLKRERMAKERALLYFVQACRGVLALHDRRLAHFDLKPSNVFIKGDIARVGDYGLSKMMADGRLTLSFGRGTPTYMAPEMMRNRGDHRADIYSLGVILYESLAGILPYKSDVPGTIPVREDDRPPAFPPDFPIGERRVVERCLRLAPDDRYSNLAELIEDLGATARPGDSVLLGWQAAQTQPAPPPIPILAPATPTRATPITTGTSGTTGNAAPASTANPGRFQIGVPRDSDAHKTAVELTRGAVEVARGMWAGIAAKNVFASPAPSTLQPVAPRPVAEREAVVMQGLGSSGPTGSMLPALSDVRGAAPIQVGAFGAGGTIPVPPRAAGGWFGAIYATVRLALEILLALARGIFQGVARGFGRDTQARRVAQEAAVNTGRLLTGLLRLAVFLLALAAVGAIVTFSLVWLASRGTH